MTRAVEELERRVAELELQVRTKESLRNSAERNVEQLERDLAARDAEIVRLRDACKMTVDQWDDVRQPGAACEDCPDPDYVAACRAALAPQPATEVKP